MSRPRFLADHDLNEHLVRGVLRREPAIEFIHARDIAIHERSDAKVLAYATEYQMIVVSHDVNTMPANAYARIRAGVPVAGLLIGRGVPSTSTHNSHLANRWCSVGP